jgi:hypothetical protein
MSVTISASSNLFSTERVIAVKIVPNQEPAAARRSFHLALLLDTSGSMEGGGLSAVIRTLHLLIDALADGDSLTLIGYQSTAYMVANATVINTENRAVLHAAADGLTANGGTNLEDALTMLGTVQSVDSVFIMTDGHVNQGIASSTGLLRILGSSVTAGTPVNTLGYGSSHNSRLLRDMAVRSRGSYTFADADELLPAIIGDITGGLANEIGRNGALMVPDGWQCEELGWTTGAYNVGTLIADKEQWIVLRGPATAEVPTLNFTYAVGSTTHTIVCDVDSSIPKEVIAEQMCRVRVANVFATVTDHLEAGNRAMGLTALEALGVELDASDAKDRAFVIRLRAQVDTMIEALQVRAVPFGRLSPINSPPQSPRLFGAISAAPDLSPVLSRMASNTAALGLQRGFVSGLQRQNAHGGFAPSADPSAAGGLQHTFSSPAQRHVTQRLTAEFSQAQESTQAPESL